MFGTCPVLDSLNNRGYLASRVHLGLNSLGAMGLQGARVSSVHPA